MKPPQLIFIFSLPRTGSTWLQRMISSHPQVATTAEPWLLLPLLSAIKPHFSIQPYGHDACLLGIQDSLAGNNHNQSWSECYQSGVMEMANSIYSKLSAEQSHFLDKTPRYSLICEEIIHTFQNAKFIFLWRHPYSIVASMQKTWGKEHFILNSFAVDLHEGLMNLLAVREKHQDKVFTLQYEQLASRPQEITNSLSEYLKINLTMGNYRNAEDIKIKGKMGDPNQFRSDGGRANPNWQTAAIDFCSNRYRKNWLKNYTEFIGEQNFSRMGYDYKQSTQLINQMHVKNWGFEDTFRQGIQTIKSKAVRRLGQKRLL